MYEALFQRIKSTDFPLECRGMYYFAKGRHAHQERKGSGMPYFIHPRGVAYIVMEHGGTIDQINAALAHDLLEDTETSFLEIKAVANGSVRCAELCAELRNNKYKIAEMKGDKEKYMSEKLLAMSNDALLVKLADMLYNSYDQPAEKAAIRMIHNAYDVLMTREDVSPDCKELAQLVFLG